MGHRIKGLLTSALLLLTLTASASAEYPPKQLPERMLAPESATWNTFEFRPGVNIRYVSMTPEGPPRGTLVMVHGLTAAPEFHFELFRHFLDKGLAVWALDMPGQGKSPRWLDNSQKVFIDDFSTYVEAVDHLRTKVMPDDIDKPIFLMGISMGGHIVTRYAGEHPGKFDAVIAEVPMYDIVVGNKPVWLVRAMAWFGDTFGLAESYIPGDTDWALKADYQLEDSCCTTDPQRDLVGTYWRLKEPELRMGGVTYRWLNKAYESMDRVNEEAFLKQIEEPVLILSAGKDNLVNSEVHPDICAAIKDCELVYFPESKHVPTIERDEIRNKALAAIDQFLETKGDLH